MSDDIVTQLRDRDAVHSIACGTSEHWSNIQCVRCVAADEIERLRHENEILHKAAGEENRAKRMTRLYKTALADVERLQYAGDLLWESLSRHRNTRRCRQCQDSVKSWKEARSG